jgi:hypothetical protein
MSQAKHGPECRVPGCDRLIHGHGYCPGHYRKWRLYGDPQAQRGRQAQRPVPPRAPQRDPWGRPE